MGELANSQDQLAVGEIWALAGGGANTNIATESAIARNNFIDSPVSFDRDTIASANNDS